MFPIRLDEERKISRGVDYKVKMSEINTVKNYIKENYPKYIEMYRVNDEFDLTLVAKNVIQKVANGREVNDKLFISELKDILYDTREYQVRNLTKLPVIED